MRGRPYAARREGALDLALKGIPAELVTFVQKTYGMLAFSLLLGAAACWGVMQLFPFTVETVIRGGREIEVLHTAFPRWGVWALWIGTIGFSMWGSAARSGARSGEVSVPGLIALVGMVVCAGAMLGPTIGFYLSAGMTSVVVSAAVVTFTTFTALTAFVMVTGKNFTFMRGFVFVAFWCFFAAWMVNAIFIESAGFAWWMSAVGALLFSVMILYNTSAVIREFGPANLVIPAVITLFINIFNLFVMLLTLFAGRRGD